MRLHQIGDLIQLEVQTLQIHLVKNLITTEELLIPKQEERDQVEELINIVHGKEVGEMELTYPLFIMATDDKSIKKFDSWDKLKNWYEQIDIEEGLFLGWDLNGYPFKLVWDKSQSSAMIETTGELSEIDQLRNAIRDYARDYRPKAPFDYSGSNVVELFKTVEDHINQGKLSYKIKMKLKSLWKK